MTTRTADRISLRWMLLALSAYLALRVVAWVVPKLSVSIDEHYWFTAATALVCIILISCWMQLRQVVMTYRGAAEASEQRLRTVLDDVRAIAWEADPVTFRLLCVSARAEDILGYPISRWTTEPGFLRRHLHPDDRERVLASLSKAAVAGGDHVLEYRMVARDRRHVWFRDTVRAQCGGSERRLCGVMVDISSAKAAEDALQRSETTNGALLDAIPDLILRIRRDGTFLGMQGSRAVLAATETADLAGKNLSDVLPPEFLPYAKAVLERALDTGRLVAEEVRVAGRDFDARTVACGPYEVIVVVRDITQRKCAESALRNAEAELRRVLSSVSDNVWSAEIQPGGGLHYFYQSPVVERITGRAADSFGSAERWLAQVHPEDRPRLEKALTGVATGRSDAIREEYRIIRPDGTLRWVRSTISVSRTDNGRVRLNGVDSDITDRKAADEAFRQASEALDAVIQASPLAIFALDLDGRVKSWNPAATRIFGWAREEVLGFPLPFKPLLRQIECGMRGTAANGVEISQTRKDGSQADLSVWTAVLRQASGEPGGYIALAADITGHRQLEEQLRQSQKMEAIGRLAGGVAHDFNNLLTVITGYGYMLLDDMDSVDPLRSNVEEILRAVERASALTAQLLAFGRRQIVRPKVLDLTALVADTDRMLRRVIGEDIELSAVLCPQLGKVKADPGQIEQVLMNLVVNARDAMPGGGRIVIRTANVELGQEDLVQYPSLAPGRYVKLSVTDTGHGMDAWTKAHLFEPFFTTKDPGKGTGLGLSTVYGIVTQSGGGISADSDPGAGTAVHICLPRIDEAAAGGPREARDTVEPATPAPL